MNDRNRWLVICLLGYFVSVPSLDAQRQSDTTVLQATSPIHAREGRLVLEATFGRTGDARRELLFSRVQNVAVSSRGDVYVLDDATLAKDLTLRHFAPDGSLVRVIGRVGDGPGEFRAPRSVHILKDGRLLVASGNNWQFYNPNSGGDLGKLRLGIQSTVASARGLLVDKIGTGWVWANIVPQELRSTPADALRKSHQSYVRARLEGVVLDTVELPSLPGVPTASAAIAPFASSFVYALSPEGYFVTGHTSRYAIDLRRPPTPLNSRSVWKDGDPVLSIRREIQPTRLQPGEFEDWLVSRAGAQIDGRGSTAGSATVDRAAPRSKPAFLGIQVGEDGRIWVTVSTEAELDRSVDAAAIPRAQLARLRWPTPRVHDIYEPDGRFVGTVRFPTQLRASTMHVARGDYVWLVVANEDDEQVVQRYRIVW